MDIFTLANQVVSLGPSIFKILKREKKKKEVYNFFQKKYQFTRKTEFVKTGSLSYGMAAEYRFSDNLFRKASKPFKVILKADKVDDVVRESAGEIYLLAFIHLELSNPSIEILSEIKMYNKELHTDLYELSRGRGNQYTLKLIKKQLKSIFKELGSECEIKQQTKKAGLI